MNAAKLGVLGAQVGLIVLVVQQFHIEGTPFFHLSMLCFVGFLVHALLPLQWRLPFFVLLSWTGVAMTLGAAAAWVGGIGLLLIGLCHLPLPFGARVALLGGAGVGLAVCRVGWLAAPWPHAVWPVLGSMFMFRLLLYAYDLRHGETADSVWQPLAYFFLLPTVCFALFPVIDYKTFRRTYYDTDPYVIYQIGVQWMLRGIVHLLLYRFIYHYCTLAPSEVHTGVDLLQFLLANFGLYLRVSGTFHLIVGILHLFGFNLPETHHLYFMASSVADFWRRINIYWKDFMQKLFFLPSFFALRRRLPRVALALSTLLVFFATWMLHSYQWFWIGGTFPFTWQDATFWSVLGLIMMVQMVYFDPASASRHRSFQAASTLGGIRRIFRVATTFLFLCTLWSLWTADSFAGWAGMWAAAWSHPTGTHWAALMPLSVCSVAVIAPVGRSGAPVSQAPSSTRAADTATGFWRVGIATSLFLIGLYLISLPPIFLRCGREASSLMHTLRNPQLNRLDQEKLQRGYYEDLFIAMRIDSPLAQVQAMRPPDWVPIAESPAGRRLHDLLEFDLKPSTAIMFKGAPFHVNRWGMRDRDYTLEKPPGTYRIALLGSSHVMGLGVADDESFENLVEERLNRDHRDRHYEILNFAVGGYSVLQEMVTLERKAFDFNPDAVFCVAHHLDPKRAVQQLARVVRSGATPPYPFLVNVLRQAGVDRKTRNPTAEERLAPYGDRLLKWAYQRIADQCRQRGVLPVWIFLQQGEEPKLQSMEDAARDAGFTIIDLTGVYAGHHRSSLGIAPWDDHPNAVAHRLIADRLYAELEQRPEVLGLAPRSGPGQPLNRQESGPRDVPAEPR